MIAMPTCANCGDGIGEYDGMFCSEKCQKSYERMKREAREP